MLGSAEGPTGPPTAVLDINKERGLQYLEHPLHEGGIKHPSGHWTGTCRPRVTAHAGHTGAEAGRFLRPPILWPTIHFRKSPAQIEASTSLPEHLNKHRQAEGEGPS